jgi:arylsulfatase A-like enzyme/Tfp pilus assembly protein PilF
MVVVAALVVGTGIFGVRWLRARPAATDEAARERHASVSPAPKDVNVVVVTLDTTRADRLGCYGFAGVRTPHLDALAADGVLFEQAMATVPLTFPSHSSMFTGLVPPKHGVRDNGGFFLEASKTTLAERLKAGGWATGAFVSAWVLDSRWGLDQGFEHYGDHFDLNKYKTISLGTVQKPGGQVMDDALRWMETVKDRRFHSWIHLYDPHTPYEPPPEYEAQYPGQRYVAEIAYTDSVVGRLTGWLRERGLMERTIVVVMGDHGESLGAHGESTHAFFIYDATQQVPFIVRTPWGYRGRAASQVSGVDLMPTVLDLVGLPPVEGIDGRSLLRLVQHPRVDLPGLAYAETYFPRYHFGWQHLRAVRDGRYKYVDAPRPELYDVLADPGETRNLYKSFSKRGDEMRQRLEALAGNGQEAAPKKDDMDPDTLQRLAALGYVGNTVEVDPTAVLPDPKDKIGLFGRMSQAKAAAQDDDLPGAIAAMRAVIAEDPNIVDAHVTLATWLRRAEKVDEAIAQYQEALRLQPDNELALSNLANVYRAQGRHDAALEGYRRVLELEPRNPQTWYQMATLYLDRADVKEAERTLEQAVAHNPKMGAGWNSLGVIAFSRGRYDEAERLIRKALELEPELRTGRFNLGRLYEQKGDLARAEALYREELATYTDHGKARFNLAQLLRQRGDRAAYLGELRAATTQAPEFGPAWFFLAREELQEGRLDEASRLAREGLKVASGDEVAPLGHYVLADVHTRRGEPALAEREVAQARKLEAALRRHPLPAL